MQDSIFTKIIKGEIPSYKLYEDDKTIAFLDIHPTRLGHTLVVPKKQIDQYIELPDEDYVAMWTTVKKVARVLRDKLGKERVGIIIKGVDVPHAHVHLIPFDDGESLKKDENSPSPTPEEFTELTRRLTL
ncbi:MAG TPA: HIT domain-containing protein [Candidatus Saccharimonadales bacterium]